MNDDWSETTGERDWGTAQATDDDSPMTPQEYDDALDLIADLMAVDGLSERDYRLLDALHHELAIEACENRLPLNPEDEAEEDAEVAEMMAWAEELMKTVPGGGPRTIAEATPRQMRCTCTHSPAVMIRLPPVNRLQDLLWKTLSRGRDDAELDELAQLLNAYRRKADRWERCEIDGRTAYRRQLDCGHAEIVHTESEPRGGIIREPNGTERELPLSAVCHTCYRDRGNA